jgi:hypothetical protein
VLSDCPKCGSFKRNCCYRTNLCGGLDAKGIHQRKGLKKSQQILDHMGSTELAANLYRNEESKKIK